MSKLKLRDRSSGLNEGQRDALNKLRQLGEDRISDELAQDCERLDDRLELQRLTLAERYLKRNGRLHFHFSAWIKGNRGIRGQYCARFHLHRAFDLLKRNIVAAYLLSGLKNDSDTAVFINASIASDAEGESPVLVDPVEFMDAPQGVISKVASMMRLKILDDCAGVRIKARDAFLLVAVHGVEPEDRKFGGSDLSVSHVPPKDSPNMSLTEGEREMVEGGTQIVDAIANKQGEPVWNTLDVRHSESPMLPADVAQLIRRGIRIWLIDDSFGFALDPLSTLSIEPFKIFLSPPKA